VAPALGLVVLLPVSGGHGMAVVVVGWLGRVREVVVWGVRQHCGGPVMVVVVLVLPIPRQHALWLYRWLFIILVSV
jgi:hypothetical protein